MTDTSREAVERLLDGVTPGPWWVEPEGTIRNDADGNPRWDLPRVVRHSAAGQSICKTHLIGDKEPDPAIANARFIAAARDLVPALLARAEAAEARLHEFQAAQGYLYIGRDMKPVLARDLEDRAEAAEKKLAKAVEALVQISRIELTFPEELRPTARAALAEIKGESHE